MHREKEIKEVSGMHRERHKIDELRDKAVTCIDNKIGVTTCIEKKRDMTGPEFYFPHKILIFACR